MPFFFRKSCFKTCLSIVIVLLLFRCVTLSLHALSDPTEGRYALISKEIVTSGNWVTPHIRRDGQLIPFLGKPPLYFWSAAACIKVFGVSEFSVRLPGFLSLVVTLFLMWKVLARYADQTIAWRSVFMLVSSVVIFVSSGIVIVDVMVMMSVAGALLGYYAFMMEPEASVRKRWSLLIFVMLSIGFMTKGPVTLVLFGLPVLVWTGWFRRWRDLKDHAWIWGSVLFLIMTVPWFVLCEKENPGFLRYFFVNENFLRFVIHEYGDKYGSGHEHIRGTAIWMMVVAACPWSFYAFYKLIQHRKQISFKAVLCQEELAFFLCVVVVNTLFWSLARQLLISYLFPMVPLFAVWLAMLVSKYPVLKPNKDTLFKNNACIIVISVVTVFVFISTYMNGRRSTKLVIDQAIESYPTCRVYFLRQVPFSAYFYGGDKVIPHPKELVGESVRKGLMGNDTVFVAKLRYYERLFEHHPYRVSFKERYGEYVIFEIGTEVSNCSK